MERRHKAGTCDYQGCTDEAASVVISVFHERDGSRGSTRARFCCTVHAIWWMEDMEDKKNNQYKSKEGLPKNTD